MQRLLFDTRQVRETLSVFLEEGQVAEIRVLGAREGRRWPQTLFGYFNSWESILDEMQAVEHAEGFYFVPNPVDPALLARSSNRLRKAEKNCSTSDSDILRRKWLLVDLDPVRPAGISSTEDEHEAALRVARSIRDTLQTEYGWPEPILADSGNGAHLIYSIDLPVQDDGLVRAALTALDKRFSDEKVSIDSAVHNPSRMLKLYGTRAGKGDDTEDRPHRMSGIIDRPRTLETVSKDLLERLADDGSQDLPVSTSSGHGRSFDLETWIQDHSLAVDGPTPWVNGSGAAAQRWTFAICPWNPDHTDASAYIVRFENGAIAAGCHHNGCQGKDWHALRDQVEPGWKDKKEIGSGGDPGSSKDSQATFLTNIAIASCELFTTPDSPDPEGYARVSFADRKETLLVRSKVFRNWLSREFYLKHKKPPGAQALSDALNVIEAKAIHDGEKHPVAIRLAQHDGQIYLDLGGPLCQSVRIGLDGWEIVPSSETPVRFIRKRGMQSLPVPERGGDLDALRQVINLPDEDAFRLLGGWIVAALRPSGPYAILIINGEQGSAKSTLSRMIRGLIDPNVASLRRPPRNDRDLMIAANNSWVIGFDNISGIPPWLSDSLCTLATGGGFATRELYTDDSEKLFDAMRPILLNGIDDLASRPDLTDRSIILTLPRIRKRRSERDIWAAYDACHPKVLGALLDAVSGALRNLPETQVDLDGFRMADLVEWVAAAEPALGFPTGSFSSAYRQNREGANALAIEASPIGPAVISFVESEGSWTGTATELLHALSSDGHATDEARRRREWPGSPRAVSGALRRLAPALLAGGYDVRFGRSDDRSRIRLIHLDKVCIQPSKPSKPSEHNVTHSAGTPCASDGSATDPPRTVHPTVQPQVIEGEKVSEVPDDLDGLDGRLHGSSDPDGRTGDDVEEEVQEWRV